MTAIGIATIVIDITISQASDSNFTEEQPSKKSLCKGLVKAGACAKESTLRIYDCKLQPNLMTSSKLEMDETRADEDLLDRNARHRASSPLARCSNYFDFAARTADASKMHL
jgi:hypothetical protein